MLITFGSYCSIIGIANRSVTLSTATPNTAVCPGFRLSALGSNLTRAAVASVGAAVSGDAAFAAAPVCPVAGTAVGFTAAVPLFGVCAGSVGAGGGAVGVRISLCFFTCTFCSDPA